MGVPALAKAAGMPVSEAFAGSVPVFAACAIGYYFLSYIKLAVDDFCATVILRRYGASHFGSRSMMDRIIAQQGLPRHENRIRRR